MLFKVSKTYETWNEEAYEAGETDDKGWIYEDEEFTLSELIREITDNGIIGTSNYPVNMANIGFTWLSTIDGHEDYIKGETTHYSLFLHNISDRNKTRIFKLAGIDIK